MPYLVTDMTDDTHRLLANYPEATQELVEALDALLREHLPRVQDTADISAKAIGYGYSNKDEDTPCTIVFPQKKSLKLKLVFYKGVELPDPTGLQEGLNDTDQYVVITNKDVVDKRALTTLIKAAYKAYLARKKKSNQGSIV